MIVRIPAVEALIDLALHEDLDHGDVTSQVVLGAGAGGETRRATLLAKEALVVCGLYIARRVFAKVDPACAWVATVDEGQRVPSGTVLAEVAGPALSILAAERTALNFVQRLSGIATLARAFADAVVGTSARVCDTRKTTPGWRFLEKQAVVAGGCHNHRPDLGSGILIKDNHIAAVGGVRAAVESAREHAPHPFRIEVEVTSAAELDEALAAGADVVLLDNMDLVGIESAARRAHERGVLVEVSGGVTLSTVADIAGAGADFISVGALTHSARAVDISLELEVLA